MNLFDLYCYVQFRSCTIAVETILCTHLERKAVADTFHIAWKWWASSKRSLLWMVVAVAASAITVKSFIRGAGNTIRFLVLRATLATLQHWPSAASNSTVDDIADRQSHWGWCSECWLRPWGRKCWSSWTLLPVERHTYLGVFTHRQFRTANTGRLHCCRYAKGTMHCQLEYYVVHGLINSRCSEFY